MTTRDSTAFDHAEHMDEAVSELKANLREAERVADNAYRDLLAFALSSDYMYLANTRDGHKIGRLIVKTVRHERWANDRARKLANE